jgi:hypothetical protein
MRHLVKSEPMAKSKATPIPNASRSFRVTKIAHSLQVVNQTFPQIIIVPATVIQVS